ncbi:N-acetylmuramoyl-L-alanine amidase [Capnocytophaga leadbetteri]|uniref:N-acetylmuramoyl-L-alanine amidase n=1 Tax=Capnocytophaga leadbetteri TaxID=327575 RepID=UPI0028D6295E|nr:N-acetylmuramoyl-L-alanine amidase [Capnocytophaga leadbetteri]
MKKSTRQIKYLVVHCSATPEGRNHTAKDIDAWHRQRGFDRIGYNYVIRLDGTVEEGRDVNKIPSHVKGYNKESIGICYIGGIDKNTLQPKDTRTPAQKEALKKLLIELKKMYPQAEILGHRDFPNVAKACPCFNAKFEYKNL